MSTLAQAPRRAPRLLGGARRLRIVPGGAERIVGAGILGVLCLAFVVVPIVSSYSADGIVGPPNSPPSTSHLFGTDSLGRDLFTRSFAGGRTDVLIAGLSVVISVALGTIIGVLLGLTRQRFLAALGLRFIDAVLAIPFVILILSLVIVLGAQTSVLGLPKGVGTVVLAIVLVDWAIYARLARTQTLALRDREYVLAARLLRYSKARILLRHVAPNVIPTTFSYAAADAILVIMGVASLAFLGSGIQEPTPELGNIMYQGHNYLATTWWVTILPGIIVLLLGASFALIADSLEDDD